MDTWPRDSVVTIAEDTDRIVPGVAHVTNGFENANAKALTDTKACDPTTGTTGPNSCLCRIEKLERSGRM
jgi:anaerobic selenocysteine-containing dehydrogenase